ncbi:hypothetical protein [Olleya sp. R77988]|uniref:hypothetical protein n=1 Tax=Olleya sp. R77988 TaxID=3093875 RepID=UPI0037C5CBFC
MSNTFQFAERFGFEPPFEFSETLDKEVKISESNDFNGKGIVTNGIRFMSESIYNQKYKGAYISNLDDNLFLLLAKKNKPTKKNIVVKLSDSGITHENVTEIFNIALGKNLVRSIEKDTSNKVVKNYVSDILDWMEIPSSDKRTVLTGILLSNIESYVKKYPSTYEYTPPNGFEEAFKFFQMCLELGVMDISETADYVSEKIILALANTIRGLELGEEKWNPNVANTDYGKENNLEYDPLLVDFSQIAEAFSKFADQFLLDISNDEHNQKYAELKYDLWSIVSRMITYVKKTIVSAIQNIINKVDTSVKKYNAYLVGLINGVIRFIASIVEAIGFIIGLLNYDNLTSTIDSLSQFFSKLDWPTFKKIISDELSELFNFMDGDEAYKNAYEFGLFIPKLVEIVLDIIGLVKGVSKGVKKVVNLAKDLPKQIENVNAALKQISAALKLPSIPLKTIKALKQKGISLDIKVKYAFDLNSAFPGLSFPKRTVRGRDIKVSFKEITLRVFTDEKKAKKFLDDFLEGKPLGGRGPKRIGTIIGKFSKRSFNPEKAGGPILDLDWKDIRINSEGLEVVKKHLSRFGYDEWNERMITRLQKIIKGEINVTDFDKRFYTHEKREYERYTELGFEETLHKDVPNKDEVWNDAHTATLEDYKVYEKIEHEGKEMLSLYHPEVQVN